MAVCESTTRARAPAAQSEDLRTLVEIDRRRGSISLHITSDLTRAARTSSSLWLAPDAAEWLAQDILAAVPTWREHQATAAWTSPKGGRA